MMTIMAPIAYAVLLHEIGHAIDPELHNRYNTIGRELTAWEFVLANTVGWNLSQHDYLVTAMDSYARQHSFSAYEMERYRALLSKSFALTLF